MLAGGNEEKTIHKHKIYILSNCQSHITSQCNIIKHNITSHLNVKEGGKV